MTSPWVGHVYVHVPFCRAKCDYCDFASVAVDGLPDAAALMASYIAAVHAEWAAESARHEVPRIDTLYLGGGTPSLLGRDLLERLLEPFTALLAPDAEVTIETNPEDVSEDYAAWAAARGLRISLGVQSFLPHLRTAAGRRSQADPELAIFRLRSAGIADLGIDLMFGIPGQRLADIARELIKIAMLAPDHVSWYELEVNPGTPLAERLAAADLTPSQEEEEAAEDERALMYVHIVRGLEDFGFDWYEVSNFATAGHHARHNVAYWRGRSYLGLGPAAVSTVGADRWHNAADVAAYIAALVDGQRAPARSHELLTVEEQARERLFLAARMSAPVALADVRAAVDESAIDGLADAGLVSLHGGTLTVTRKGRYVANAVCVRLFRDLPS